MELDDVRAAQRTLEGVVQRTPLTRSATFSRLTGAEVYLKCENLQRTGSFKLRGAYNRLAALSTDERSRGVVAASAGNHAQGVALAAQLLGIHATVYMPLSTPLAKVAATQSYGAAIQLEGQSYDDAYQAAMGGAGAAIFVHPFDDERVMAGQGTVGLEVLQDLPAVDAVLVPVGGGGLIAGIATAARALRPSTRVIGVQAAGANAVWAELHSATPESTGTIADGTVVKQPGKLTLEVIRRCVDEVLQVQEEDIARAMVLLLERSKLVVEGAGALGLAALLSGAVSLAGKKVAVVLSGGNLDINLMARVIEHGLSVAGRYLIFETWLEDKPGELLKVLDIL
ncbi:MAG: threonine ammonia-lyase, partial [Chloroflexi bacterium]|nr:threonine ammonia-lyase [Chloroflexota bacterium]